MPLIHDDGTPPIGRIGFLPPPLPEPAGPSTGATLSAAFRLENTAGAALAREPGLPQRGALAADISDYDPFADLAGYEEHAGRFVFANSAEEVAALKRQIDRETSDRETLAAAGAVGIASGFAAGLLDPINLLPVGGAAVGALRGARGALATGLATARAGLLGSTAAELALQASQETRTLGESAVAVAGGTLLSGVLGAAAPAVVRATRSSLVALGRMVESDLAPGAARQGVRIDPEELAADTQSPPRPVDVSAGDEVEGGAPAGAAARPIEMPEDPPAPASPRVPPDADGELRAAEAEAGDETVPVAPPAMDAVEAFIRDRSNRVNAKTVSEALGIAEDDARAMLDGLAAQRRLIQSTKRGYRRIAAADSRPLDVIQFLSASGGIRDQAGELRFMDATKTFVPGVGPLVRRRGMTHDEAGERLWEAGYFGPPETTARPTTAEVLELIDESLRGTRRFSVFDEADLSARQDARQAQAMADELEVRVSELEAVAQADRGLEATRDELVEALQRAAGNPELDPLDLLDEIIERAALAAEGEGSHAAATAGGTPGIDIPFEGPARGAGDKLGATPGVDAPRQQSGGDPAAQAGERAGEGQRLEPERRSPTAGESSAGAAQAGPTLAELKLKSALGLEKRLAFVDPGLRTATSPFLATRKAAAELIRTPFIYEQNALGIANPVPVETLIDLWDQPLAEAIEASDRAFLTYRGRRASEGTNQLRRAGVALVDLAGAARQEGKLTRRQFDIEIARAMRRGDRHEIPEVATAAAAYRRLLFDPLKDRAIAAGLLPEDVSPAGAVSYLTRIYDAEKIVAQRPEFVSRLTTWLSERQAQRRALQQDIAALLDEQRAIGAQSRSIEKKVERRGRRQVATQARLEELRSLMKREVERAMDAGEAIRGKGKQTARENRQRGQQLARLRDRLEKVAAPASLTRKNAAGVEVTLPDATHAAVYDYGRALADGAPRDPAREAALFERLNGFVEDLGRADEIADLARDVVEEIDGLATPAAYSGFVDPDEAAAYLRAAAGEDTPIGELGSLLQEIDRLGLLSEQARARLQGQRAKAKGRGMELGSVIAELRRRTGRLDAARQGLDADVDALDQSLARLAERHKATAAEIDELLELWPGRHQPADARQALKRLTDLDEPELRDQAQQIVDRILGTPDGRLPYDIDLDAPRQAAAGGRPDVQRPLRARKLTIPDEMIEPWLVGDVETIARVYRHTMAADVEMATRFGSVDLLAQIEAIRREHATRSNSAGGEKARAALDRRMRDDIRDIAALRDRIRGTFGYPSDPRSVIVRAGRTLREVQLLSKLGGVTVSSFPDIARPVMVEGLGRVTRRALLPLVRNGRGFRLAREEARFLAAVTERTLSTRLGRLAEVGDAYGRHSLAERAVGGLADTFGTATLIAPWNQLMKEISGVVTMSRILEESAKWTAGSIAKADIERLAAAGIDREMAQRLAAEFAAHGLDDRGVLLANTGAWSDLEAVAALRAAVRREVDATIVTPGAGQTPLWMSSPAGKLIGQFRSFAFASSQSVLIAGLQRRDAATLNGLLLSIAGGMAVYAFKSWQYDRAPSDDPRIWLAEGIDRAGVTGWLFDVNNLAEKTTRGALGVNALSGGPTMSRFASRNVAGALFGPTIGTVQDTAQVIGAVATGEATASDTRAARRLIPYQNLFYLRGLFDRAEHGLNGALGVER